MSAQIVISEKDSPRIDAETFTYSSGRRSLRAYLRTDDDAIHLYLSLAQVDAIVAELLRARAEFVRTSTEQSA